MIKYNVTQMDDENLVKSYIELTKRVEALSVEFNKLPLDERKNGSERARELVVSLTAYHEALSPVLNELSKRVHEYPERFSEYVEMISEVNPFVTIH